MSTMSTDRHSAEHLTRTGSCVHISRPTMTRYEGNRNNRFAVTSENQISARMALLLKQHEEQRALQQRKWEVETRALEKEKRLLQRKYSLLIEQSSKRRDSNKRTQVATTVVANREELNNSISLLESNELPTDTRVAKAADYVQRQTSIVQSKQQLRLAQSAPVEYPAISSQSQSNGIQQRHTNAHPVLIPETHERIIESNTWTANNITPSKPNVSPSRLPGKIHLIGAILSRLLFSYDAKPTAHRSGLQTASLLSVCENSLSLLGVNVNSDLFMNGQQASSSFKGSIMPDPDPPPPWDMTLEHVEPYGELGDLGRSSKVYLRLLSGISSKLPMVLMDSNESMYNIRCGKLDRAREYHARVDDIVDLRFVSVGRTEVQKNVLHYRCCYTHVTSRCCCRSVCSRYNEGSCSQFSRKENIFQGDYDCLCCEWDGRNHVDNCKLGDNIRDFSEIQGTSSNWPDRNSRKVQSGGNLDQSSFQQPQSSSSPSLQQQPPHDDFWVDEVMSNQKDIYQKQRQQDTHRQLHDKKCYKPDDLDLLSR